MTGKETEETEETKHNSIDQIKKELKEATKREKEEQREQKRQEKISKYPEWMKDLQFDNFGNLKRSLTNYIGLLTKCDDIGQFKYDVYTKRRIYTDTTGKAKDGSSTDCSHLKKLSLFKSRITNLLSSLKPIIGMTNSKILLSSTSIVPNLTVSIFIF